MNQKLYLAYFYDIFGFLQTDFNNSFTIAISNDQRTYLEETSPAVA